MAEAAAPALQALLQRALAAHNAGDASTVERLCQRVLEEDAANPDAWHLLGVSAHQHGRRDRALECLARAVDVQPTIAAFHYHHGLAHHALGHVDEAITAYRRALELDPTFASALNNLGVALASQDRLDEAVACYERALPLTPASADLYHNLGNARRRQHRLDEAVAAYARAIALTPHHVSAHDNLGVVHALRGEMGAAEACFRRVAALPHDDARVHTRLGETLWAQRRPEAAVAAYRETLRFVPDDPETHFQMGVALLQMGHFLEGWPEYEWRWKLPALKPRTLPGPRWKGWPLGGQTILLHVEQGLGDTIQFIRYAALVESGGARVVVECPRRLIPLLSTARGVHALVAQGEALPPFDTHAPLLSVPGILGTTVETIPGDVPYLAADPVRVERWRPELRTDDRFTIGLAWRGSPDYIRDGQRSLPLALLATLARVPGVRLISLQKGPGAEEVAALAADTPVLDLGPHLDETAAFLDRGAAVASLDLVISADTSLAHLAGALGAQVWLALAFAAEWRWLLHREDTPWYPTARLFRQAAWGRWEDVVDRMARAVAERARLKRGATAYE